MMRMREWPARHRFFVDMALRIGDSPRIDTLARQLSTVLRLAPGESIRLFNGDGCDYLAVIHMLSTHRATAEIVDVRQVDTDPHIVLTLHQCTLKQDKFEWVLQKGAELGVTRFAPIVSARSIVRPAAALHSKAPRWTTILREATEQCGRTRPPHLQKAVDWPPPPLAPGEHGFVAWEEAEEAPSLGEAVAALKNGGAPTSLAFVIGPEGGLTHEEVTHLAQRGWQIVSLGARILRAETAAVAAITIIMDRCGELEHPHSAPTHSAHAHSAHAHSAPTLGAQ
jgi:16S rRNA (uracil1498-N3)-methyltransferase